LKLLVYEHVSGGGFADQSIPAGILSEGFAMLRTLISDFKAAGHNVSTTLDSRISRLNPPIRADCVVPVFSSQETQIKLCKLSEQADAVYVIAPETGGVLQSLVTLVKQTGATSLNCSADIVEKVSDKAGFYEYMRKLEVPLPKMIIFNIADDLKEIKKTIRSSFSFPVICKPSDGVSCCGVSVIRNEEQVVGAVSKIKRESSNENWLVQEFVQGVAASASLLSTGSKVLPVTLNSQDVIIGTPETCSSYRGGMVPFDNPVRTEAFEVAKRVVKSISGLQGYVGVDFVLTKEAAVIVEVNPRLTTSYVGLRKVVNFNPAQAVVSAVLKRKLPDYHKSCGCTYFSKVETPNPTVDALEKTYRIDEVVSPPFPILDAAATSGLLVAYGATLNEASLAFREAKKRVLNTINRGK
jgi:predicted ATP-grasp superfamily ATP-dependent carboligase